MYIATARDNIGSSLLWLWERHVHQQRVKLHSIMHILYTAGCGVLAVDVLRHLSQTHSVQQCLVHVFSKSLHLCSSRQQQRRNSCTRRHPTLCEDVQVFAFADGLGVDVGAVVRRPSLLVVDGER